MKMLYKLTNTQVYLYIIHLYKLGLVYFYSIKLRSQPWIKCNLKYFKVALLGSRLTKRRNSQFAV